MYSNTAYEALYLHMGLQFQEEVTHWITSQVIFRAGIVMIFAVAFFMFLAQFAFRYLPIFFTARRAPIGKVIILMFCLCLGISLLKVGTGITPINMSGASWSQNPYIVSQTPSVKDQYQVSMIFRLLSGLAEELARGLSFVVDATFSRTNPQATAPRLAIKAMGDEHPLYQIFNIGNEQPVLLSQFIECLEKEIGKNAIQKQMPIQAGDMLSTSADTSALRDAIAYQPQTSIAEGIHHFVKWYREYYGALDPL